MTISKNVQKQLRAMLGRTTAAHWSHYGAGMIKPQCRPRDRRTIIFILEDKILIKILILKHFYNSIALLCPSKHCQTVSRQSHD